jgi:hypothetical protein
MISNTWTFLRFLIGEVNLERGNEANPHSAQAHEGLEDAAEHGERHAAWQVG